MIAEELRCLRALNHTSEPDGEMCVPFIIIQEATYYDRAKVKRHVRRLARKGYAEYFRALWSDEGLPAGAGYCVTRAGREFVKANSSRVNIPFGVRKIAAGGLLLKVFECGEIWI